MIKQTLVGLIVAGYAGYVVEGQVLVRSKEYPGEQKTMISVNLDNVAKSEAGIFVGRVLEFRQLTASGALDDQMTTIHRDRIRSSFEAAYSAIRADQERGAVASADTARAKMEVAISEYMLASSTSKNPRITRDLDAYSRFLTETSILRSLKASEAVN